MTAAIRRAIEEDGSPIIFPTAVRKALPPDGGEGPQSIPVPVFCQLCAVFGPMADAAGSQGRPLGAPGLFAPSQLGASASTPMGLKHGDDREKPRPLEDGCGRAGLGCFCLKRGALCRTGFEFFRTRQRHR